MLQIIWVRIIRNHWNWCLKLKQNRCNYVCSIIKYGFFLNLRDAMRLSERTNQCCWRQPLQKLKRYSRCWPQSILWPPLLNKRIFTSGWSFHRRLAWRIIWSLLIPQIPRDFQFLLLTRWFYLGWCFLTRIFAKCRRSSFRRCLWALKEVTQVLYFHRPLWRYWCWTLLPFISWRSDCFCFSLIRRMRRPRIGVRGRNRWPCWRCRPRRVRGNWLCNRSFLDRIPSRSYPRSFAPSRSSRSRWCWTRFSSRCFGWIAGIRSIRCFRLGFPRQLKFLNRQH